MGMSISVPPQIDEEKRPKITVVGVGGAGGNAVNNMIRSGLVGVEFVVTNTDAQSLSQSVAERRIQLGSTTTQGLGAGARADIGRAAAEESIEEIIAHVAGSNMVFITAGMGGGTGTGAAPVIARAAREQGILTVGVVTKPFTFEGAHRMRIAEQGILDLQQYVDTLIIIPNQNLFCLATERTTFVEAFRMADAVLDSGVRGVTDLMLKPGLINLDFADIRSVMSEMGKAMMGTGEGTGERRALDAAEAAISNPLLEDTSMKGAKGVLINITGGFDMTLFEADEAANRIREEVDPDANIIFGSTFDQSLEGIIRVSVVATGIEAEANLAQPPRPAINLVVDRAARPGTPAPAAAPVAAPMAGGMSAGMGGGGMGGIAAPMASRTMPAPAMPSASPYASARGGATMTAGGQQPGAQTMGAASIRYETVGATALAVEVDPQEQAPEAEPVVRPSPALMPNRGLTPEAPSRPIMAPPRTAQPAPEAPFIAPKPVEPTQMSAEEAAPARPDPFAEAAMQNPPPPAQEPRRAAPAAAPRAEKPAAQPSRTMSLFKRVTGAASRLPPAPAAAPTAPAREPMMQDPRSSTSEPAAPAASPAPTQTAEPRLGRLDPMERPTQSRSEDDLLDIPAFLRRQAN